MPEAILRLLEHEAEFAAVSRAFVDRAPSIVATTPGPPLRTQHGRWDKASEAGVKCSTPKGKLATN
jgi:hypothetical protein